MTKYLIELVKRQKAGQPAGLYSACTANKYALLAVLKRARMAGQPALIEATANQVDQNGGYTGMTPQLFSQYIFQLADSINYPHQEIILGGDHLGPLTQCGRPESQAMDYAVELVRQYICAGFTKIHLDTTMHLADDDPEVPLDQSVIASRGAQLCFAAEQAFKKTKAIYSGCQAPVYVIGSEVPFPGGAREVQEKLSVTKPEDYLKTIEAYQQAFRRLGLESAWQRVIGVVVQPGVEFDDKNVFVYDREKAAALTQSIKSWPQGIIEGHSTDYQPQEALRAMVEDGIAILKVGPALTFALREALFSLEAIEQELYAGRKVPLSNFQSTLDNCMLDRPQYWNQYYHGNSMQQHFARRFSYLDRSRYYLNDPSVKQAIHILIQNIDSTTIPSTILSQYLPLQYEKVFSGQISATAEDLILDRIGNCIDRYIKAAAY